MSAQDTNRIINASLRWLKKRVALQGTPGVVLLAVTAGIIGFPPHANSTASDEDKAHGHQHTGSINVGHWSAPPKTAARDNPVRADGASMTRGETIFHLRCVPCHGANGDGHGPIAAALKPRPADLVAMAQRHTDGELAWMIANGRGFMPAWKGVLSEEQIWNVVNYLRSLNHVR